LAVALVPQATELAPVAVAPCPLPDATSWHTNCARASCPPIPVSSPAAIAALAPNPAHLCFRTAMSVPTSLPSQTSAPAQSSAAHATQR